jgi:hypothetical protein
MSVTKSNGWTTSLSRKLFAAVFAEKPGVPALVSPSGVLITTTARKRELSLDSLRVRCFHGFAGDH